MRIFFRSRVKNQIMALIVGTEKKSKRLKNQIFYAGTSGAGRNRGFVHVYISAFMGSKGLVDAVACMNEMRPFAFSLPEHTIIDRESVESVKYSELAYPQSLENVIIREMRSGHREKIRCIWKKVLSKKSLTVRRNQM